MTEDETEIQKRAESIWADIDPSHSWRGEWNEYKEDLAYPETAIRYLRSDTVLPKDKVRGIIGILRHHALESITYADNCKIIGDFIRTYFPEGLEDRS